MKYSAPHPTDLAAVVGFLLLGSGLWMRAPWVSLTVCGGLLLAFAAYAAHRFGARR